MKKVPFLIMLIFMSVHGDKLLKKDYALMQMTDKFRSNKLRVNDFEPKGDEVLDKRTGLVWMRCNLGQKWDGSTCKGKAIEYKHKDAKKVCSSYGKDWRLPNIWELETLIYCSSSKDEGREDDGFLNSCDGEFKVPTLVQKVFPNAHKYSWTSSRLKHKIPSAWMISFDIGYATYDDELVKHSVRCVK